MQAAVGRASERAQAPDAAILFWVKGQASAISAGVTPVVAPRRGRRRRRRVLVAAAASLVLIVAVVGLSQQVRWWLVLGSVRLLYPGVEQLSTVELARWIGQPGHNVVLLDVREAHEQAVSHLPGAILVRPGSAPEALEAWLPRGARAVAYCGLGYRSSSLLERIGQARGDLQLHNLEGSIFKWALEGRPLARGDAAARVVHPFSPRWAKALLPAERLSTR